MSKQDYDAHKKYFMDIPHEKVKEPFMPVSVTVQMGEDLFVWAQADKDALVKAGLDATLIEELPSRAGAVRYMQSEWKSDKNTRSDYVKKWKAESPEGYDLQAEFAHVFRFAFYNQPDLLSRVDEITANNGHADMIQDLMDYSALGKDNLPLLQGVGFDTKLLKRAEQLAGSLSETLAYNNNDKNLSNELKEQRDRAYMHLYDAIREINRVGQFVFWRNPERKKGYVNTYNR